MHCWLWCGVAPALGVTVAVRRVPVRDPGVLCEQGVCWCLRGAVAAAAVAVGLVWTVYEMACFLTLDSAEVQTCRKLWCSAVAIHRGSAAVLGKGCLHARCMQTVLGFRRAENCGGPQLQFWTKWTCRLLRRQVHLVPQMQFRRLWTSL